MRSGGCQHSPASCDPPINCPPVGRPILSRLEGAYQYKRLEGSQLAGLSLVNQTPPVRRPFCTRCASSGLEGVWHITYARTLPPTHNDKPYTGNQLPQIAINNIISEIIARCDLTPALAHRAVGWSRLTLAAYARSAYQIEESEFHCLGRRQNPKASRRNWSCTLKMKLGKISAISEKHLRVIATCAWIVLR